MRSKIFARQRFIDPISKLMWSVTFKLRDFRTPAEQIRETARHQTACKKYRLSKQIR
jgi:hypothetical protein